MQNPSLIPLNSASLNAASIEWAIDFTTKHSDGDLFPKVPEMEAISNLKQEFISQLSSKPVEQLKHGACRRFIVPKDQTSYRQATQLDPQDSIILTTIIHQFGIQIEKRRLADDIVFSYRFSPSISDGLYKNDSSWNNFWEKAHQTSKGYTHILYCDIADFYNQISHHTAENQLIQSNFPNQIIKWVIGLLESTTEGVSRGVPIGPHAIHLIAEATLIPIDNSLQTNNIKFIRYADDIIIFCESEKKAYAAIGTLASILDRQQRLTIQKHKTKIFTQSDFEAYCEEMIQDRPISHEETDLMSIIKKYSKGNPYALITFNQIDESDWKSISESTIASIISKYLFAENTDYAHLRWFYRRLSQIGHPGALNISLKHIEKLTPCLATLCNYITSIQTIEEKDWLSLGDNLIHALNLDEINQSEYFKLSILSLFSKVKINHFTKLAEKFSSSDNFIKREILLAAKSNNSFDWIREHKESFKSMDPWQRLAFLYCTSGFPSDEKKYFITRQDIYRPFEIVLCKWIKAQ